METDILKFLNEKIREEHGSTVYTKTPWTESGLDSYGSTVVFFEMDDKYGCFDKNWLAEVEWSELIVQDLIDRILNESKVV